jgi:uncharacterized protein
MAVTRMRRGPRRQMLSAVGQNVGLQGKMTQRALDAFVNALARTGDFTSSLENGTSYPLTRLTLNFWALVALYEGSWIARRIIDAPAQDIIKTWPKIISEADPKDLARVDAAIRKTNTKGQVLWGIELGRLFGGAGALIVIKGHEHDLDQPLDLADVGIGDYKGLSVFDRWSGIMPTESECDDIERPLDVGLPEYYQVSSKGAASFKVHASRVLRFCGPKMPEPENSVYSDWGISVLAPVMQSLKSYDNVSANALSLSFRANLIGMKEDTLAQLLSGAGMSQAAAEGYAQRMSQINQTMSNQSLIVLGKEGELSNIQYSFGGLAELIQMFQLQLAGAAKMPVSLLWGRLYNGLGNSGEGDERLYEKTVATEADITLRPALEKLLPVICVSELGEVPEDMTLNFPSIRVLDEKEKAELAKTVVDSVTVCINTGLMSPRIAAMEIKQASETNDFGSNLTDEFIASLSDKVTSEGEGMGEGLFGESKEGVPTLNPDASPSKVLREEAEHRDRDSELAGSSPKTDEPYGPLSRLAKKVDAALPEQAMARDGRMTPELVWLEACDNEALSVPRAIRGTEEGQAMVRRNALRNLQFYAEQFKVPYEKCLAYVKGRGLAWDARTNDADGPSVFDLTVHGVPVSIETRKGDTRKGFTMVYDYGFIPGADGADGDSMDVALGPAPESGWAYVFDQRHLPPRSGFDEHKVFLGWDGLADAVRAYNAGHDRACQVYMDVTPMRVDELKAWLKDGDHKRPVGAVKK